MPPALTVIRWNTYCSLPLNDVTSSRGETLQSRQLRCNRMLRVVLATTSGHDEFNEPSENPLRGRQSARIGLVERTLHGLRIERQSL